MEYTKSDILDALMSFKQEQDIPEAISYINSKIKLPKKFKLYDEQLDIFVEFMNAVEKGHKIFVCNFPTGIGKSVIANCMIFLLKHFKYVKPKKSSVIITHQKLLQTQYFSDFNYLLAMKGKSSFFCQDNIFDTVNTAKCSRNEHCDLKDVCEYHIIRRMISEKKANMLLLNYSWYLTYQPAYWCYNNALAVQVFDEAHLMEDILIEKYSIRFNKIKDTLISLNDEFNIYNDVLLKTKLHDLFNDKDIKSFYLKLLDISNYCAIYYDSYSTNELFISKYNVIYNILIELYKYLTRDETLFETSEYKWDSEGFFIVPLKNIYKDITNIGDYNIFLSSTIPSEYVKKNLISDFYYMERKTLFDKEKRLIYTFNNTFYSNFEYFKDESKVEFWLSCIDKIIDGFPNDNGIIFVSSFYMVRLLRKSRHIKRLILHDNEDKTKSLSFLIYKHKTTKGSILVSPSISTGYDFKGDLSRFQIITKIPYTNYDSPERRIYGDDYYYNSIMNTIIQMTGRSIRDKSDYASTFILDSSLQKLIEKSYPPSWWLESLIFLE